MLMGIELMLNAVNINIIAFWRYFFAGAAQDTTRALAFVAIVFVAAAAEAAVGLALIISVYRRRQTVIPEDMTVLKG
jgi:NADH-quinone oxidoreductase subunit K